MKKEFLNIKNSPENSRFVGGLVGGGFNIREYPKARL